MIWTGLKLNIRFIDMNNVGRIFYYGSGDYVIVCIGHNCAIIICRNVSARLSKHRIEDLSFWYNEKI